MFKKISKFLQRIFIVSNYRTEAEQFIMSKKPQSIAEVEHWVRIFDQRQNGGSYGR